MAQPGENKNNTKPAAAQNPLLHILSNAVKTTASAKVMEAGAETRTCRSCGAARPAGTDLQYCDYCGHSFY